MMDEKERLKLYEQVWLFRGQVKQTDKLMEEMSELTKEIFKGRVYHGDLVEQTFTDKICEEFGDVENCSEQLRNRLKNLGLYEKVEAYREQKLQKLKKEFQDESGTKPGYG
jgi:hypothetical protein